MSANNYTQEQILSGIRIIWREVLDYEGPLELDTRFMDEFEAGGALETFSFGDVIWRLQRDFGFACSLEEWKTFLGFHIRDRDQWEKNIAPRLTFRALVDFIQQWLEPITFEPVNMLGKPCLTAGVFRGLERLAAQVHPKVTAFAPSTPIRECLRGLRLHRFWIRLRWMVHDELPPPPKMDLHFSGCMPSLCFKLGIGLLIALWKRDLTGLAVGFVVSFLLMLPTLWIIEFIEVRLNPLPEGIETFGDLSRVLAAIILDQQSEGASCSTP